LPRAAIEKYREIVKTMVSVRGQGATPCNTQRDRSD
jgi:hypothetical protein